MVELHYVLYKYPFHHQFNNLNINISISDNALADLIIFDLYLAFEKSI